MSYVPSSNGARSRSLASVLDRYAAALAGVEEELAPWARGRLTELDSAVSEILAYAVDLVLERECAW